MVGMKLHVFTSMTLFDLLNFQDVYRKHIKLLQMTRRDSMSKRKEEVYCFTCNLSIFHVGIIDRQKTLMLSGLFSVICLELEQHFGPDARSIDFI